MTPEQASKLKALSHLAIASVRAAQAIRGVAGSCMDATLREAEFVQLHNQALQEVEAGTFEMERFEKSLRQHYEKWHDFEDGGITSPPMPEGGEFVTPKPQAMNDTIKPGDVYTIYGQCFRCILIKNNVGVFEKVDSHGNVIVTSTGVRRHVIWRRLSELIPE